MKKILTIVMIAVIALSSCSKDRQKLAEEAISDHLRITLNDPSSYEPGLFTPIDSLFESPNGRVPEYDTAYDMILEEALKSGDDNETWDKYQPLLDSIAAANKGRFIGYWVSHSYRAKNSHGGVVKESGIFYIDKKLMTAWESEEDLIEYGTN